MVCHVQILMLEVRASSIRQYQGAQRESKLLSDLPVLKLLITLCTLVLEAFCIPSLYVFRIGKLL